MPSPPDAADGPRGRHAKMLAAVGLEAPARPWPQSAGRFADGARYHFEIASVEGPVVLRGVLAEAEQLERTEQEVRGHEPERDGPGGA